MSGLRYRIPANCTIVILIALIGACSNPPHPTVMPTLSAYDFVPPYRVGVYPKLPPSYSVNDGIWPDGIPAKPITVQPWFVEYPNPTWKPSAAGSNKPGCTEDSLSDIFLHCSDGDLLALFRCDYLGGPGGVGVDLAHPVVAVCHRRYKPDDPYLYQVGCHERDNVSFIAQIDNQYVLVDSESKMKQLFAPIDSSAEALSYVQMRTGLLPYYSTKVTLENTVFFQEVIEGTHVTETEEGYVVFLFQQQSCGCNISITSQVEILVRFDGEIVWQGAKPLYLRVTGLCTD